MRAIEIMYFLTLFNLSMALIGSVGIYQFGLTPADQHQIDLNPLYEDGEDSDADRVEKYNYEVQPANNDNTAEMMGRFAFSIFLGAIAGTLAGIISWKLSGIPGDSAFLYGMFATTFWIATINSASLIGSIGDFGYGLALIIGIFLLMCGFIFIVGFAQLIRGGWKAYM